MNTLRNLACIVLLLALLATFAIAHASGINSFIKALKLEKIGTVTPSESNISLVIGNKSIVIQIGNAYAYVSQGKVAPIITWSNGTHIEGIFLINETYLDGLEEKHLVGFATFYSFPIKDGGFMYALWRAVPAYYDVRWIQPTVSLSQYFYTYEEYIRSILYPFDLNITVIKLINNILALRLTLWNRETGKVIWQRNVKLYLNGAYLKLLNTDWILPLIVPAEIEKGQGYVRMKAWLILFMPYRLEEEKNYTNINKTSIKVIVGHAGLPSSWAVSGNGEVWIGTTGGEIRHIDVGGVWEDYEENMPNIFVNMSVRWNDHFVGERVVIDMYTILHGLRINMSASPFKFTDIQERTVNITVLGTDFLWGPHGVNEVPNRFTWNIANESIVFYIHADGRCQDSNGRTWATVSIYKCPRDVTYGTLNLSKCRFIGYYYLWVERGYTCLTITRTSRILVQPLGIAKPGVFTLGKKVLTNVSIDVEYYIRVSTSLSDKAEDEGNTTVILNYTFDHVMPRKIKLYRIFLVGKIGKDGSLQGIPITLTVIYQPRFDIVNVKVSKTWLYPSETLKTDIAVTVKNVGGQSGTAHICVASSSGATTCKEVTISPGEVVNVTFLLSGLWISGGDEGNYTLKIYVVNDVTNSIDDVKYLTVHVYYPLFKIADIVYNDTSIYSIGTIDGVWGGSTIRLNVKVCNYRTGGHVILIAKLDNATLSSSSTVFVPLGECAVIPIRFRIHSTYEWKSYTLEAYDVDQGTVDDMYTLKIRPGPPEYVIVTASTDRKIYRPYDNASLLLIVRNIGKSVSNFTVLLTWSSGNVHTLVTSWTLESTVFGGGYDVYVLNFTVPTPWKYPGVTGNLTVTIVDPLNRRTSRNVTITVMWPVFEIVNYTKSMTVLNGTEVRACVTVRNTGAGSTANVRLLLGGTLIGNVTTFIDHDKSKTICIPFVAPKNVGNYTMLWVVYDPYEGKIDSEVTWTLHVKLCPMFKIVNVTPSIVKTAPGMDFTVTACVKNLGAIGQATVLLLDQYGNVSDSAVLYLSTGQVKCVDLMGTAPPQEATCVEYRIVTKKRIGDKEYVDDVYVLPVCTFRYVPKIVIDKVDAPSSASPGTYIKISVEVKNIGNGTGLVYASIVPPKGTTCRCIKCRVRLPPEYTATLLFNCSTPLGPGLYLYYINVFEEYTRQNITKTIKINIGKPSPPIQLSFILVAVGGLVAFAAVALVLSIIAKKHEEKQAQKQATSSSGSRRTTGTTRRKTSSRRTGTRRRR